jgi:predicted RNA-binding Zn ribbon-like protein
MIGNAVVLDAGPQPGGRRPAPADLGLVQAFVNSFYDLEQDHGAELLGTPGELAGWLSRRGLLAAGEALGEADLRRALDARRGLRALLRANAGRPLDSEAVAALNRAAVGAGVELGFSPAGPSLGPERSGLDGALALILGIAARSMLDGSWHRFKVCRQHDCGWAFYDHSRNQGGEWCSMAVCGGRAKARAYYRRRRRAR